MTRETALKILVAALSDVGCKRTNNEDSFGYDLASGVFAVCDGMGGMAAGEMASGTAIKELLETFNREVASGSSPEKSLYHSILQANLRVHSLAQANADFRGMGTTLVSVCIDGQRIIVGNVGDSRAYLLRGGVCAQITNDHSFVAEQVRMGAMSVEEAGSSPYASVITRAIGAAEAVEPDFFTGSAEPGDILLLTSDGLTRYADSKLIASLIVTSANLNDACQALIEAARHYGGEDNITCLLVQFLDPEEETPAEEFVEDYSL